MNSIAKKYMSDITLLFRLVQDLNRYIRNRAAVKFVVDTLRLTEAKLKEVKAYRNVNIDLILPFTK